MADDTADTFSAARANIRETVKWLTAALAGIAVVVIGASPFVGIGSLDQPRLVFALCLATAGLAAILGAIEITLRILVMPAFFFGDMIKSVELKQFINKHGNDLLPAGVSTFEAFHAKREQVFIDLQKSPTGTILAGLLEDKATIERAAGRLMSVCYYESLRREFESSKATLFALSVVGIVALTAFAFMANPPKDPRKQSIDVTCQSAPSK